ncbi:MAG: LutC/YkgG family protein [Limisphaerales bacterium]|nr:LUD domain-containing protein [Verrucomicrobiota bacterium]
MKKNSASDFKEILSPAETEYQPMIRQFALKSAELTTRFFHLFGVEETLRTLQTLATQEKWKSLASHESPLTRRLLEKLKLPTIWTDAGYAAEELEKADASITLCDALIAQTGSLLLNSRTSGGRALSILPPHHIVLATPEQLLPDLPSAFELIQGKYQDDYPSMLSLVTGPSRTGDIERILVLGAHGPRKLTVILVENPD